jgi:hypothetical protein
MVWRVGVVAIILTLTPVHMAQADSAWAMIEPDAPQPDAGVLGRLWHHWRYGGGYVVNHFFPSADACKTVEVRWRAEADKLLANKKTELREIQLAASLRQSTCVPAAALSLFKARPGAFFQR